MKSPKALFACVLVLCLVLFVGSSFADLPKVSDEAFGGAFEIAADTRATIVYDSRDAEVVEIAANLLADDIKMVTDKRPDVSPTALPAEADNVIIVGTIGSEFIDFLVTSGKLDVSSVEGEWEAFTIAVVDMPFSGIGRALVIAGSDRRGTAYGVFTVSEAIGVSPWYWWADVPVVHKDKLYISSEQFVQKSPSIKYRGIFINDEDWGLKPWSSKNFEKRLADIGPKTYAKVCELLLRLKGNMFAPAMHSCTGAFYSHKESKVVADKYGIIITTSHCEPLLFNNAAESEWDSNRDGEWNYATNKDTILKKLDDRVSEAYQYENLYTMGMRGLHDEGMRGNLSNDEKVSVLEQVMSEQRNILTKYTKKQVEDIPQIFVPYKETLDIYNLGLEVPDDITIVWTDDNYGYIKRLSNPEEQKRSGGAGVYYHSSYLGAPHDYLWLCTTPPVLMYLELKKAYDTGADRYWLANVGDIKPAELFMDTFFDFAWDVETFDIKSVNLHQSQFLGSIFGIEYTKDFQNMLDEYYRLAWSRKPEYMGWEREWDSREFEQLADTDFSFENYNDAQQRLADYKRISAIAEDIYEQLPDDYKPAFYEMVMYPVLGSYQMNRKFLMAQLSNEKGRENHFSAANWAAGQSLDAYGEINNLTEEYNTLLNGKWNGMMSVPPGFVSKYQDMPKLTRIEGPSKEVDLMPLAEKKKLDGCAVVNLKEYKNVISEDGHTMRVVHGIGYDWSSIQLGKAVEKTVDPAKLDGSRFEYEFTADDADSVTVYVYTVPFFPVYTGKSNRFGVSVDGQPVKVFKNEPKEYSRKWKDQVLQNSVVAKATFKLDDTDGEHTLTLTCGDPGVVIQRVVIDWGGLKDSYVGPSMY